MEGVKLMKPYLPGHGEGARGMGYVLEWVRVLIFDFLLRVVSKCLGCNRSRK